MKRILFAFVMVILCVSCSETMNKSSECIVLEENKTYNSMPELEKMYMKNMEQVVIPDSFINNIIIYDSLLIVDTNDENGLLDILSVNSYRSYGKLFKKGKAKGEFTYPISLTLHLTIDKKGDSLIANAYDFASGRLYEQNITYYLKTKKHSIKDSKLSGGIPSAAFWVKTINDSILLYRYLDDSRTHQIRRLRSKKKNYDNTNMSKLNLLEVPCGEDHNIISSLIALSPSKKCLAEAMIGLNYIHIYSLEGDKGVTICIGEKFDKISDVISKPLLERKYMFADIRAYNFGFAVLKFDVMEKIFQSDGRYYPSILFFDWDGNALGEVKSDMQFNHFDYDERRNELYILDSEGRLLKKKH